MPADERHQLRDSSAGFAEHGYAVLERFLDRALLEALRRAVRTALQAPPVAGCERPHNRLVPLRWNDPAVDLVLEGAERRRAVAAVTGGDDLRWISGYVSTKGPRTPPLWWHQDWWCWNHPASLRPAAAQVALLCYLSDTNPDNGALRLLPGSHRASVPLHTALPAAHAQDAEVALDHAALSDQPGQVTLNARAGDAIVLDYRLLHGTHPNLSAQRRDCLLLSFTPSWRRLDADIRAHLIQHLAQPTDDERPGRGSWHAELLPSFKGVRADLALNREAPTRFAVSG
jgi:ectoine hydroxylase-related dioxygenase (phytanoyl-CoA dioxygenase family)